MAPQQCPFCDRVNPPDSKFCNACGSPLSLMPCPQCGAINDTVATACHQCGTPLPDRAREAFLQRAEGAAVRSDGMDSGPHATGPETEDRDARLQAARQELRQLLAQIEAAGTARNPARESAAVAVRVAEPRKAVAPPAGGVALTKPPAEGPRPSVPRRRSGLAVGAVVLVAAVLAAGYYAYRQQQRADALPSAAATGTVQGRPDAPAAGVPAREGAPVVPREVEPTAPEPTATATAVPEPAPAPVQVPARPPVEAEVAPAAKGGATNAAAGARRTPAATPDAPTATAPAAVPRPRPSEGEAGVVRQVPPSGTCTDAIAALGLCTPEPNQRKE
jgi:hypothetical protein